MKDTSLLSSKSSPARIKREFGGKGANLYKLSRRGLPVPKWIGIPSSVFSAFKLQMGLEPRIQDILKQTPGQLSFKDASDQITRLLRSTVLPDAIVAILSEAYEALGIGESTTKLVSVRSSAADEDGSKHSFAGQLSSFLYVKGKDDVLKFVLECWASGYTERGLSYRHINQMPLQNEIKVAVILQEMVLADKSGVLFTVDPVTQNPENLTISSVFGVGEGLVSGALDSDTFVVSKRDAQVVEKTIVEKRIKFNRGSSGETKEEEVPAEQIALPSLTDREISLLCDISARIESIYSLPQDVEFAFADGNAYVLQARPITSLDRNLTGALYIWDNSNIIESYGGITQPLTFTFACYVYREVYLQLCDILLVPKKQIQSMEHSLKNMLGSHYGRVYYNLLNWYKLLTIIPGFNQNRSFMETMMGVGESLSDEVAERVKPEQAESSLLRRMILKLRKIASGFKLLYYHFNAQSIVDQFIEDFKVVYDDFRKRPYSEMSSDRIYEHYKELENRLLRRWHAPIINDMLCMIHFGLLKKLTGKWLSSYGEALQNDLLCGEGNIESAEPTKYLVRLTTKIVADPELKALFESVPAAELFDALAHSNHHEFYQAVVTYIDRYGFRCMSEMKLEQPDLYHDPAFLFTCLKNYLKQGNISLEAFEAREQEIRATAESRVNEGLSAVKKIVYLWSLKHARRAVRNRENTRFCRTRVYGVVRTMFFAMGDDFVARDILTSAPDIFFLNLSELTGAFDGTCTVQDLKALVELRKREYSAFEKSDPAPRFITRGPVYWKNPPEPLETDEQSDAPQQDLKPNQLKGTGCCPGVIEGFVKVILNPQDNLELSGEILVTLRTDPGWIPLYPAASALIVERGSLLSHSAIVAREMGLPTIVSVKGLTQRIQSGMRVRMDGASGLIEILSDSSDDSSSETARNEL